jgi:hypothetical protein
MIMSRPDLIAKHPGMPEAYLKNAAARKVSSLKRGDGARLRFFWRKSQVTVSGIGLDAASDVALIRPIAQALEARVLTADGLSTSNLSARTGSGLKRPMVPVR